MKLNFLDELPEKGKAGGQVDPILAKFAEALRDNPGMWAAYPKRFSKKAVYTAGNHIRSGRYATFASGFDARVRDGVLYVRFVGDA